MISQRRDDQYLLTNRRRTAIVSIYRRRRFTGGIGWVERLDVINQVKIESEYKPLSDGRSFDPQYDGRIDTVGDDGSG